MKKVVGLGACVFDTLISCPRYADEDTKLAATDVFTAAGGPVGNALVVMSGLGVSARLIGSLGGDNAAEYIINDFHKQGVSTDGAVMISGARSFTSYILLSESKKTRTCVFDRGTVPDDPENVDFGEIDGAAALHLDGNYLQSALAAAKYARSKGVKVSLDAGGLYDGIEQLLPLVDILIPSAEFAKGITGKSDAASALLALRQRYAPEILVVTDGSAGGYYYDGKEVRSYDSFKVQAVDTNGAGDTFHGAFIARCIDGAGVAECCTFASAAAAIKCSKRGVRGIFSGKDDVEEFIKARICAR